MKKNFKQLTKAEEGVMEALWKAESGFVREVIAQMAGPALHYNTVSTLLKILVEKGFAASTTLGNALQYRPLISREVYRKQFAKSVLSQYFDGSLTNLVMAFAEKDLNASELDEILKILKNKK